MKRFVLLTVVLTVGIVTADTARFSVLVLDEKEVFPIPNVTVRANFSEDIGWRAWTESPKPYVVIEKTDKTGYCCIKGKTNCGRVACWIPQPPEGYYSGGGWGYRFKKKNLFGVWQPDNLVVTLRLDRVEKPIPLFVKRVELTNSRKGIGGFDGTNSVVRFDLMKGDWLAPYGKGETADLEFKSTLVIKDKTWFMMEPRKYDWVYFYNLGTTAKCLNSDDGFAIVKPNLYAGIKIRCADMPFKTRELSLINIGRNKKYHRNGEDWDCENYKETYSDRSISFRVRSRYDEKGNLKEAYYGKIYGDFEIQGDEKRGVISISFLYYLNPTSLDRNLEWDMKNNLCPEPGAINSPRAP
jgi:hypothetical protein